MVAQRIAWIVCSAHHFHSELLQNSVRTQVSGECGIGALPNRWSRRFIEQIADSEIALQFKVSPVIERVPQRVGNGARPCQKLLVRRGIARDKSFRDTVRPHGSLFVVAPLEPYFVEVAEPPVLRYVFDR